MTNGFEHNAKEAPYLPASAFFEVRDTPLAGRAIFATQDIPQRTTVLQADETSVVVILREYRREVCAQCFTYERGRNLKLRDVPTNCSFCSLQCHEKWKLSMREVDVLAWATLETYIKNKAGKGNLAPINVLFEPKDVEGDITMGDYPRHPSRHEIDAEWSSIAGTASCIRAARQGSTMKLHRKAVQTATDVVVHADSLYFLLAGILLHHVCASSNFTDSNGDMWSAHLSLAGDDTPYMNSAQLQRHTQGYLQLLSILPQQLLASVTPEVCQQTIKQDVHNAFGIRSLDDAGSEFFGWAVWPFASYFNHSCACNIAKDRKHRTWSFWTLKDIKKGEELTISYLGGDENELTADERGKRTESIWNFVCACSRCCIEKQRPSNGSGREIHTSTKALLA